MEHLHDVQYSIVIMEPMYEQPSHGPSLSNQICKSFILSIDW